MTRREVSRSSSDLFPFMGYVQLNADRDLPVIPYFGLSGGYEVLFLSAEDFATGEEFDGTFGGFGWQAWGGAALPLGPRAKFTGEVFINDAELGRDVEDNFTGESFRETVDMDGAGMRFGLSWGFGAGRARHRDADARPQRMTMPRAVSERPLWLKRMT